MLSQFMLRDSDESSLSDDESLNIVNDHTIPPTRTLCVPVKTPENVYAVLSKKQLDRDSQRIDCPDDILEKVFNNYVIVKNIISHLPWQQKLVCKEVCTLWESVIQQLRKEQLHPSDFSIDISLNVRWSGMNLKQSGSFLTEPLVVFVFDNTALHEYPSGKCDTINPCPCDPPCSSDHSILDVIYKAAAAPKKCLFSCKALSIAYLPLPGTPTYDNALVRLSKGTQAYYAGVHIPTIPGVEFLSLNMRSTKDQKVIINQMTEISKRYYIKGVVAYLTDNYTLYADQQETAIMNCLRHLGTLQPEVPFALGGCLVEDSMNQHKDVMTLIEYINNERDYISGNQTTIGLFLVPKDLEKSPDFNVFSFVIESTEWSREKIMAAISEFAQTIPRYEYSIALKLSCSGRHTKHELEQNYFRTLFPKTRIFGCFGNGELGVNFPQRQKQQDCKKRPRTDVNYEKLHSYSTVFMYFGWGKIVAPAAVP